MSLVKMIIGLPLLIAIAIFAFMNNDMVTFDFWPFTTKVTISQSVAIVFFLLFGYFVGKLDSWLSYAPLRRALRSQLKQNRKLNEQQVKLCEKVEVLKEDLVNAKLETSGVRIEASSMPKLTDKIKGLFQRLPSLPKKEPKSDDYW